MAAPQEDVTRIMLITANIATCFEQVSDLLLTFLNKLVLKL